MKLAAFLLFLSAGQALPFIGAPEPPSPVKASPLSAEEQRATFSLPPGFDIELVASDPDIAKIVTVAFDEAGRMWAITAVEYPVDENESPERAKALFAGQGRDRVLVFDRPALPGPHKPRAFADGLAIPLGVLPYRDGAFVGHGDKVLFLRDTDGDGKADTREVILTGFGIQDSHLFPHQFTRGPGDWFYLAQGAFNYSKVKDKDGSITRFDQTKMARFRADGSGFETVCWGPNNIWGFVITRTGDMFIQEANDLGYPVAPFFIGAAYPGIGMHKPRPYAPFQPPLADFRMGGTGLSGLALAEDRDGFPLPYKDVMYVANPITRKIQAIKIQHDGADYKLEKLPDFILSSDEWFRPVAIHFGPDSCLYIVDWYNKIISHNEVARDHPDRDKTRGRIWRVRHKSMPQRPIPDLTRATSNELVNRLSAANSWQARSARHQIIDRKATNIAWQLRELLCNEDTPVPLLLNALWALEGLSQIELDDLIPLTQHAHYPVRREAVRLLSTQGFQPYRVLATLKSLVEDSHPQVRAEVIRTMEKVGLRPELKMTGREWPVGMLLQMAKPTLAGPSVKTEQGGEIVKTGEAGHRDFERYLVRAALEKHPFIVETFLSSSAPGTFPLENRLLAALALPPPRAAYHIANLWPEANRPLNDEELAILANQSSQPIVAGTLKKALADVKHQKQYLTALLKLRERFDLAGLESAIVDAVRSIVAREPQSIEFLLKLTSGFRLKAFEKEVLSYASKTNLSPDQRIAGVRALREIQAEHPHLYQQWALASKPGDNLQREAVLALAACQPNDAVPRLIEIWPVLTTSVRRLVADKLASSKPSARAWLRAIHRGDIAKEDVDDQLFEKLKTVLGSDPLLAELQQAIKLPARPVLRLTGKNEDYVDYKVDLRGPFTVETWIKLEPGINNRDGILGAPGITDFNFHDARFRVWDPQHHDVIIAKKQVPAEVWTHVAVTRDQAGRFKVYLNGELDNDQGIPSARDYDGAYVCRTSNPNPGGPAALVTEYRIWNVARTEAEIRAHYKSTFQGGATPSGLVHYFAGDRWSNLHGNAQVIQSSDHTPLLDPKAAQEEQHKFDAYRQLAENSGDASHGKEVFKNTCAACHNVGGDGGQIGPSLNGAGASGIETLLRSLLTPNEAVESGYYTFRVETKDEEVHDGFLVRQDESTIILRQPNTEDRRIPRQNVKRAAFVRTSMMPEGLLEGIKPEEVSHLFAYLKTLK